MRVVSLVPSWTETLLLSGVNVVGRTRFCQDKYPKIDLAEYDPHETLILFSSEPYPFLKRKLDVASFHYPHAYVDGECFSWFGARSLAFLEALRS